MFNDIQRWAKKLNLEFKMNPFFPILTVPHMRGAILAQKKNTLEQYMEAMFNSIWVKALNLNDQEILTKVAAESGIDPNDFSEGISSDKIKDELRINTQFAIDKGAFGVPTYFLENEMFWGIDSIKFLIDSLKN